MMAAGKKKPEEKNTDTPGSTSSLRDNAEVQLARSPKRSGNLAGKTQTQLIHELEVHQIELETQAEELRRAHIALGESRDKFLDLYDFSPIGYLSLNDKALITEVNLRGATLLGVERKDPVGAPFSKFMPKKDADQWHLYFMNVLKQDGKRSCTLMLNRPDDTTFPARLESLRLAGSDGAITVRIAFSDISDIRQIEALKESEERYHNLYRNSTLGIFHSTLEGKFIEINPALAKMLGYNSPEETIFSITNIAEQIYAQPPQYEAVITAARDSGGITSRENQYLRRDGTLWYGMLHLRIVPDLQGKLNHYEGIVEDITERKQAEEALKVSEQKYRNVVEDQTEFICRFLPNGPHIFVNDAYCRYFDKKRKEIIGQMFRPVLHPEDREPVARHLASLTTEHPVMNIDQRVIMPDGSIRWQRWSDRAIFDPNGRVIEYQSVGRDISEQKELEKEMEYHEQELLKFSTSLAAANKKLNLLFSITRHDINNQLTVIMGYMNMLECKVKDPNLNVYFQTVSTAADRIAKMIQFTKEYEQIGVNAPAWQDCHKLVETAAKQAPLGKVIVKNDLPAGMEVFADPLVIKVYYNLMDNAVRYGGKISTIRFSVEESGDDRQIVCEDDGDGIVAAEKEKIFERGFGKNTGLGLALSREILSITGITITETGDPGKGARFEMTVPKGAWRNVGKDT